MFGLERIRRPAFSARTGSGGKKKAAVESQYVINSGPLAPLGARLVARMATGMRE